MPSVDVDLVTKAVCDLIAAETAAPVGVGRLPTPAEGEESSLEALEDGSVVVFPINTPTDPTLSNGWRGQRDAVRRFWFEVVGYGLTVQQAQRLSHLAYSVVTERDDEGDFVHPLPIGGHTVMARSWSAQTPGPELVPFGYRAGNLIEIVVHASG